MMHGRPGNSNPHAGARSQRKRFFTQHNVFLFFHQNPSKA
jgi:hypothetical protein